MANSKLIVIEGPQGSGKTTITDYIRSSLSYTNLYRLCGTSDTTPTGKLKAKDMYDDLLEYLKKMENKSINLLFDRTFFTEEIYCRLGFKEYSFTDVYNELLDKFSKLDFDIYYITLYLSSEDEYEKRLNRPGKAKFKNADFDKKSSMNQQQKYLELADEIATNYKKIKVYKVSNDSDESELKEKIRKILNF